jgi:hypothetical protein
MKTRVLNNIWYGFELKLQTTMADQVWWDDHFKMSDMNQFVSVQYFSGRERASLIV